MERDLSRGASLTWALLLALVASGVLLLTGIRKAKPEHRLRTNPTQTDHVPLLQVNYVPPHPRGWVSLVHQAAQTPPDRRVSGTSTCI